MAISIPVNFSPGFVYGLIIGLPAPQPLEPREQSRHISERTAAIAIAAIIAWRLQLEFSAGSRPWIGAGVYVAGIQTATLSLIPLRFLPGYTLRTWHPLRWGVLWGMGLVLFVLGIVAPGCVAPRSPHSTTTWIVIAAFNMASLAFRVHNARADEAEKP